MFGVPVQLIYAMNGRLLCSVTRRGFFKYHHYTKRKLTVCHRRRIFDNARPFVLSFFYNDIVLTPTNGVRFFVNFTNEEDYECNDDDPPSEDTLKIKSVQKHNRLCPDSDDPILKSLVMCFSLQDVLDIVSKNHERFTCEHVCLATVVLWDIQKIYYKLQVGCYVDVAWNDRDVQTNEHLKVYITKRNQHPTFNILLDLVEQNYDKMNSEMLSCTFLFLNKIGLSIRHNMLMQSMLTLLEKRMENPDFPFTAYSRFAVALRSCDEIWSYMLLIKILHDVDNKIVLKDGVISTIEDFHLYTIVMRSCTHVLTGSIFKNYKKVVETFYTSGKFENAPPNTIIKLLSVLNFCRCHYNNSDLMRKLLIGLIGREDDLKLSQVIYIQKLLQNIMEPRDLMVSLKDTCAKCFKLIETHGYKISPPLLSSCSSMLPVIKQKAFQSYIKNYVFNEMATNHIGAYSLIPLLKLCPNDITNTFWSNCFKYLQNQDSGTYEAVLLDLCVRYLNFTTSMSYSYQNYVFENNMVQEISKHLLEGTIVMKVNKFVVLASFILTFGLHGRGVQIPEFLYTKLLESSSQLMPYDCFLLSRSLRSAFETKKKKILSSTFFEQYVIIINALNLRLVQCMKEMETINNLYDLNYTMRAFINMKGTRDDHLYPLIISGYSHLKAEDFSSQSIRNTIYNLIANSCYLPEVLKEMIRYVCDNNAYVTGDTMGKVIYACYFFDHKPEEKFLQLVADTVTRDYEWFNGLNLIQTSLGLAYFQHLPIQLIQHIFSVQFLETLDREIKLCYSKEHYPSRVRYHLMQLNRVVCLDILEADVPWFHDKYCQQLIALESKKSSHFHSEVLNNLVDLLGSEVSIKQRTTTPYGYMIDFLIQLNENNQPVSKNESGPGLRRIAILLEIEEDTPGTEGYFSKGALQLKKKHLEILNYEVLVISSSLWTAMFMSEDEAKTDYLKKALSINLVT